MDFKGIAFNQRRIVFLSFCYIWPFLHQSLLTHHFDKSPRRSSTLRAVPWAAANWSWQSSIPEPRCPLVSCLWSPWRDSRLLRGVEALCWSPGSVCSVYFAAFRDMWPPEDRNPEKRERRRRKVTINYFVWHFCIPGKLNLFSELWEVFALNISLLMRSEEEVEEIQNCGFFSIKKSIFCVGFHSTRFLISMEWSNELCA